MLAIKISKEILKDMLRECEKSGEAYGEMDVNPITLYQKQEYEDAFNPVVGIVLSDSGEISTKIRTKYRPADTVEEETGESSESEENEGKEESVLKKICKSNRFYRLHAERAREILKKKSPEEKFKFIDNLEKDIMDLFECLKTNDGFDGLMDYLFDVDEKKSD